MRIRQPPRTVGHVRPVRRGATATVVRHGATATVVRQGAIATVVRHDRRGSIAIVAALTITAVLGMASLAVDTGLLRVQATRLQAAADAAALAVTWAPANAASIAAASLASNGMTGVTTTITPGMYCADPTLAASARFTAGASSCPSWPAAGTLSNAAQVQLSRTVPLLFGFFSASGATQVQAQATAVRSDVAGLTAGTTALTLDGGAVNGLLGGLLGVTVSGSAVSYAGLLGARVDVVDLLNALAARAGATDGTYGNLAGISLGMSDVAAALAVALAGGNATGSTGSAIAALALLGPTLGTAPVRIGALIDVGPWSNDQVGATPASALHGQMNAYLVIADSAQIRGGALFSVPTLATTLPLGIGSAGITAAAVSPPSQPFFGFGPIGETVRTSQVRIAVSLVLTAPLLGLYTVTLPLYMQVASGVAQVSAIACGAAPETDATVALLAQSGLADAYVGQVSPTDLTSFATTPTVGFATLVNVGGLLTITGFSHTTLASSASQTLTYTQPMIAAGTTQSVAATNLPSSVGQSLGGSNLQLKVTAVGLGAGVVTSAIQALLAPVLSAALDPLVNNLLSAFGIRLGVMDVAATGVRCGIPALVQ